MTLTLKRSLQVGMFSRNAADLIYLDCSPVSVQSSAVLLAMDGCFWFFLTFFLKKRADSTA